MKKEVKFLIVLLLFIVYISGIVLAQEIEFNSQDINSWHKDIEKFDSMDAKDKNSIWKTATPEQKQFFIKKYLEGKYPDKKIDLKGFDDAKLIWGEKYGKGTILGTVDAYLPLGDLPKSTVSIEFDGKKFIMKFEDKSEYSFSKGTLLSDGTIAGVKGYEKVNIMYKSADGNPSIISMDEEGVLHLKNAAISIGDNRFVYSGSKDSESYIKMNPDIKGTFFSASNILVRDENGNSYTIPGKGVDKTFEKLVNSDLFKKTGDTGKWFTDNILKKLKDVPETKVYFGSEKVDLGDQGIQVDGTKLLKAIGRDIEVTLGSSFKEVNVKTSQDMQEIIKEMMKVDEGFRMFNPKIKINNGKSTMSFEGDRIFFSRQPTEAAFAIDKIVNGYRSEDFFQLKSNGNSFRLYDSEKNIVNMANTEIFGGLRKARFDAATVAVGMDKGEYDRISKLYSDGKITAEEYYNQLKTIRDQELTISTHMNIPPKLFQDAVGRMDSFIDQGFGKVDSEVAKLSVSNPQKFAETAVGILEVGARTIPYDTKVPDFIRTQVKERTGFLIPEWVTVGEAIDLFNLYPNKDNIEKMSQMFSSSGETPRFLPGRGERLPAGSQFTFKTWDGVGTFDANGQQLVTSERFMGSFMRTIYTASEQGMPGKGGILRSRTISATKRSGTSISP